MGDMTGVFFYKNVKNPAVKSRSAAIVISAGWRDPLVSCKKKIDAHSASFAFSPCAHSK